MIPRTAEIGNCGGVVHRVDRDATGDGAGGARGTDQIRVGVGHRPGQGSTAGQGVTGRILVAVAEGHRLQHQRIVGHGVGSGKRQGAGATGVADNRDSGCAGHRQRVIGSLQPAGDLHRGTGGLRIVHIGQRQSRRDRDRTGSTFSETVVCGRNHRRIGGRRDGDGAAQGGCQRRRNGGTRIFGIGTVIQRNGELAGRVGVVNGRVIVAGIAVAQPRQKGLHCRRGGVAAGERDGQVSARSTGGCGKGKTAAADRAAGNADMSGCRGIGQHRQCVSTDIGIKMNGQRTGAAGEEVCRTVWIGNREGTADELQRRAVALGIDATQSGRTHHRRIVVAHNGHTQRYTQGRTAAAISHGIGQRARCHRRIGGVLEGQVFEDALGNRSGSRTVQRDDKVVCRAAGGSTDVDPGAAVVILDIPTVCPGPTDVAISRCRAAR